MVNLRLKGFFDDRNQKSTFDTKISSFEDYLYEYCNFGCAYFILRKLAEYPQMKNQYKMKAETDIRTTK